MDPKVQEVASAVDKALKHAPSQFFNQGLEEIQSARSFEDDSLEINKLGEI